MDKEVLRMAPRFLSCGATWMAVPLGEEGIQGKDRVGGRARVRACKSGGQVWVT